MAELLRSVGIDVGTTTTQLVVSALQAENKASSFAVPEMEITERRVLYRSPIHFTPLIRDELVDGQALRELVAREYENAGLDRQKIDTGAIIITGETSRKENAATALQALSDFAGDFVVATAGPDLESVLAAKGAGATAFSEETGRTVLHMDIGGGTTNLAQIHDGVITATSCLNVGGRLVKFTPEGIVTYVSPVLRELVPYREGHRLTREAAEETARLLAQVLESAAGLRERSTVFHKLVTEGVQPPTPVSGAVVSFSGGVADCIDTELPWLQFGDLGPLLGKAIRESKLCAGDYRLGQETIRATVIGAGSHSVRLSGSTVYHQDVALPLKNLPVVLLTSQEQELPREALVRCIRSRLNQAEGTPILGFPGWESPEYTRITALADAITDAAGSGPVYLVSEADMAKALGHALALRLPPGTPCLCLDRIRVEENSYLDVGLPVGPAMQVVIKTLIFSH